MVMAAGDGGADSAGVGPNPARGWVDLVKGEAAWLGARGKSGRTARGGRSDAGGELRSTLLGASWKKERKGMRRNGERGIGEG